MKVSDVRGLIEARGGEINRPSLGGADSGVYGMTDASGGSVVAVPSPQTSGYYVVYMTTIVNTTVGSIDVMWQVRGPSGTAWDVARKFGMATVTDWTITWQGGLVLLPGYSLEVKTGVSAEVPWSAHFASLVA